MVAIELEQGLLKVVVKQLSIDTWERACKAFLDERNHRLQLFVREARHCIAVLDLVLTRHQQRQHFEVSRRLRLAYLAAADSAR